MRSRYSLGIWLLCLLPHSLAAQEGAASDSLRRRLQGPEEIRLNASALRELRQSFEGELQPSLTKPWMQPDETLPTWREAPQVPKGRLTLSPYTATTRYDWDPVAQKKIALQPKGPSWAQWRPSSVGKQRGMDLMLLFTRDFWDVARHRRRERTREVLAAYGDSITALLH